LRPGVRIPLAPPYRPFSSVPGIVRNIQDVKDTRTGNKQKTLQKIFSCTKVKLVVFAHLKWREPFNNIVCAAGCHNYCSPFRSERAGDLDLASFVQGKSPIFTLSGKRANMVQ
jgi:hypothetical protein